MTSIVGIRCKDGVVIGADTSATFGDGRGVRTIEQKTNCKIEIVGDRIIIAGTGYVGHAQRYCAVVQKLWDDGKFANLSELEIAKLLSQAGVNDFAQTMPGNMMGNIGYTAFVGYPAKDQPCLCELIGPGAFQPEIKKPDDLWFTSSGSGQPLTDPFLALLKETFWHDGPPTLEGGIFTTYWALKHACNLNPGGIKEPINIAVLSRQKGKLLARMLEPDELEEHANLVTDATMHMRKFRDILEGKQEAEAPPQPPKQA